MIRNLTEILAGTCQLSSNTDEGLRLAIRSHPTLIGQYVAAVKQLFDRTQALSQARRDAQKADLAVRQQKVRIQRLQAQLQTIQDPLDFEEKLIELESAKLSLPDKEEETALNQVLVADCLREIELCESEIARIQEKAGYSFAHLPTHEFQNQLAKDTRARYVKRMAALALSQQLGLPLDVADLLLDIPEEDRMQVFQELNQQLLSVEHLTQKIHDTYTSGQLPVGT